MKDGKHWPWFIVGMIVVTFILVVVKLATSESGLPLGQILAGFIPNPGTC